MVINVSTSKSSENVSVAFDLEEYLDHPDGQSLPLVRVGDTIFVPDTSQSNWSVFMENVRDMVSIVSLVAIIGGL
jgi:hypothetical protein